MRIVVQGGMIGSEEVRNMFSDPGWAD